jgi:hypothetical protein
MNGQVALIVAPVYHYAVCTNQIIQKTDTSRSLISTPLAQEPLDMTVTSFLASKKKHY